MTALIVHGTNIPILAVAWPIALCRIVVIVISLGLWFWTQRLIARRVPASADTPIAAALADGLHRLTARYNERLRKNPWRAKALLIASSLVIDLLGIYLLLFAIFGSTFQPFVGLLMLFALRQVCQAFCPLPAPQGMIWQDPGFPALLVTYGTSNDLFFSGHTAIAVYGAATLASALGVAGTHPWDRHCDLRNCRRPAAAGALHDGRFHGCGHRLVRSSACDRFCATRGSMDRGWDNGVPLRLIEGQAGGGVPEKRSEKRPECNLHRHPEYSRNECDCPSGD